MPSNLFSVGVDLGGTWIRLEAVDATGRHVRSLRAPAPAVSELPRVLKKKLLAWKARPEYLYVASRGIWTPAERARLKGALHSLARDVTVMSDVEGAWYAAFGSTGAGVIIIAGTGSIAFGRDARGRIQRAGGWGPLMGDEGSSFWIGKTWLQRTRPYEASPALLKLVRNAHEAVRRVAALAPQVLNQARAGNRTARQIIQEAQNHLAAMVIQASQSLHFNGALPLTWGGTLLSNPAFRAGFLKALRRRRPIAPQTPAANPALVLARLF